MQLKSTDKRRQITKRLFMECLPCANNYVCNWGCTFEQDTFPAYRAQSLKGKMDTEQAITIKQGAMEHITKEAIHLAQLQTWPPTLHLKLINIFNQNPTSPGIPLWCNGNCSLGCYQSTSPRTSICHGCCKQKQKQKQKQNPTFPNPNSPPPPPPPPIFFLFFSHCTTTGSQNPNPPLFPKTNNVFLPHDLSLTQSICLLWFMPPPS